MPPEWNWEASSFCPVSLSVCYSVAKKSLTLAIIFELQEIDISYLACILKL